ncbi:hypothetical protein [Bradyrhizobium sp. SZCCHNS2002]|uniref:hypothetical protein n=1 Tax=Bradyrhizobium sp. SZCCHNS2002 TaxID=3057302 RepID=UPI002915D5ED|nr:hypothetical protein [Bradyrhizobium sp. SZCCHNS2002]
MSPATFRRFVVKAFDYEEWAIVVEARSREEAIDKAETIYLADGFGPSNGFELAPKEFLWKVEPFVQEVRQ